MKKILVLAITLMFLASCGNNSNSTPDENIDITNLWWNYTYLWFVWTYCPYCRDDMPVLDSFYREYKDQINMQLFVMDRQYFRWDYIIPQDINPKVTFKDLTWEECSYVPSYIILDNQNNIIDGACWGKLTFEQLEEVMNVEKVLN